MRQVDRILEILDDGQWHGTDDLMARTKITRVAARIFDIGKMGYRIETRTGKQYGSATPFKEYRLTKEHTAVFHQLQALKARPEPLIQITKQQPSLF